MEELDRINIQTTSSEGQTLQTVINNGPINLTTQVSDVPQIQTVIQDNIPPISSVINNPFVEVTSVNGMTGDVITEAEILGFIANKFYKANTLISYNGNLYWAKQDFTSTSVFDVNDWNLIEATGVSEWDDIQNKPTFATVATSGSYNDLSDQPSINNGSLTIKRNNTLIGSFTANSSTNTDINITVPTKTSELTNDSRFITTLPIATTTSTGIIQVGDGLSITNTGVLSTELVTTDKVNWSSIGNLTSGGLKVVEYTYSRSIVVGDNQFSVNASSSIPSGFTAVGLVGLNMSGSGYTRVIVNKNFIDTSNNISISCFSNYSVTSTMTFTWYILCIKSA